MEVPFINSVAYIIILYVLISALAIPEIGVNMYLSTQVVRIIMYLDRNGNLRAQIVQQFRMIFY